MGVINKSVSHLTAIQIVQDQLQSQSFSKSVFILVYQNTKGEMWYFYIEICTYIDMRAISTYGIKLNQFFFFFGLVVSILYIYKGRWKKAVRITDCYLYEVTKCLVFNSYFSIDRDSGLAA